MDNIKEDAHRYVIVEKLLLALNTYGTARLKHVEMLLDEINKEEVDVGDVDANCSSLRIEAGYSPLIVLQLIQEFASKIIALV